MEEYYYRKSGQIPSFGNWESAKDMPITQYFECARQAGLVRYASSGECDPRSNAASYNLDCKQKSSQKARKVGEKRNAHANEGKKEGRICDSTTELPKKNTRFSQEHTQQQSDVVSYPRPQQIKPVTKSHKHKTKAVDEDLYKISPELLQSTEKKKMPGFLSWCICAA